MKKLLTFVLLALLTIAASAQTPLRKTWDFRNGFSSKTVNALAGDQEEFGDNKYWRNYEGDATKADQQHFWCASKEAKNAQGYACTHNGGSEKVISELEGLTLGFSAAKKFVITYNGAQKANEFESEGGPALGEMIPHGVSYIWLNGKKETIKFSAEVNQTIKIGVESHAVATNKLGEARGISLSTGTGKLELKTGNPVPTYYTECEWELTGNEGEVAELTIQTTNGCHIYYIIVGEGDDPNANKTQVGYVTSGDATSETAYNALANDEEGRFNVTLLDEATLTADVMNNYSAIVIGPGLLTTSPAVEVLKNAMPFTPILNLNASLYEAWGYGQQAVLTGGIILNMKHDLFAGFSEGDYEEADGQAAVFFGDGAMGVKPGDYFAGDDTLMVDGSDATLVISHIHNPYHNAYLYMPANVETPGSVKMLYNAIDILKASKSEVEKAPAPKIALEYKNKFTNVKLNMASSSLPKPHIYYTLDGTEPTEQSAEYEDVISVDKECTVKAVAIAEGYLLSDVAEAAVSIYTQPVAPEISFVEEDGKTIVTVSTTEENVDLWYNFATETTTDTLKSVKYTEPFVITAPQNITAFAVAGGMVFSEPAAQRVLVKNAIVRIDPLGVQFDANAADWQKGGSGSTIYYFTWGKNAASIYDTTQEGVTTVDPETGDEVTVYPEREYEYYAPVDADGNMKGWEVKSKGQVMIWQSITVGSDPGNDSGYNPESASDIISYAKPSNNDIQFAGKTSGEAYTGAIQSTAKYQAPFDIITIVGTAAGGDNVGKMMVQVSADSLTWTNVGDTLTTSKVKRLWKSHIRSYEGSDEVYVRVVQVGGGSSVQIYNIYVMNAGEKSAEKKAEYDKEYEEANSTTKGDVNGDGKIDVEDVVAIVNKILGEPAAGFNEAAADVTGDGKIDVDDVVAVVNIILEGNGSAAAPKMMNILLQNGFRF